MKMKGCSKIILLSIILMLAVFVGLGISQNVRAQTKAPQIVNVNFPCPDGSGFNLGNCPPSTNIPSYLNNLYKFAVGIAGLLALGMIVAGGVYYTVSAGSSDKQREARDMITSAIWGVVLLFASYMILNTINPQITSLSVTGLTPISPLPSSEGGGTTSNCPDFSGITLNPGDLGVQYLDPTINKPSCGYRKNVVSAKYDKNGIGPGYYSTSTELNIQAGSYIWTYPYFKGSDSSNPQCLVYAYQDKDAGIEMVSLNNSLHLCAPQTQKTIAQVCTMWDVTYRALNLKSMFAQQTIKIPVSSTNFPYTNPNDPPPYSALIDANANYALDCYGVPAGETYHSYLPYISFCSQNVSCSSYTTTIQDQ